MCKNSKKDRGERKSMPKYRPNDMSFVFMTYSVERELRDLDTDDGIQHSKLRTFVVRSRAQFCSLQAEA